MLLSINAKQAAEYAEYLRILRDKKGSADPKEASDWAELNADALQCKATPGSVHVTSAIQGMSVKYHNEAYVGELLCPVYEIGKQSGTYFVHGHRDSLAYPSDAVAPGGKVNELDSTITQTSITLQERSLKQFVNQETLDNQDEPLNELMDATGHVLDGLQHNREGRIETLIITGGNYAGNTAAIAAGDRWDTAAGGDPASDVDTARASCRPGGPGTKLVAAMDPTTFNVLKRHQAILDSFKYTSVPSPKRGREMLADYFDVEDVVVGKTLEDTANTGQVEATGFVWSTAFFALLCVAPANAAKGIACFGRTFQDMSTRSDQIWLPQNGPAGQTQCRSTRYDLVAAVAPLTSYLLTTPRG